MRFKRIRFLNADYYFNENGDLQVLHYHDLSDKECLDLVLESGRDPNFKELRFY